MATILTRNLKLRIDSNLTANSKYNLERIDLLGGTFLTDTTDQLNIRSRTDILIEPESADLEGSGLGGSVSLSTASHLITTNIYSSQLNITSPIGTKDQASSGTKYLRLQYKSDLNGSVDLLADRTLSIDLEGADRSLILSGNLSVLGGYSLALNTTGPTSVILPITGTLATLAGNEILTNKQIDADSNTLLNIRNASIATSAAIAYSKLNLTGSITNADVSPTAAIVYSKLNLVNSLLDSDISIGAGISRSKLASGSVNHVLINDNSGLVSSEAALATSRGGTGISGSAIFPSGGTVATNDNTLILTNKSISGLTNTITGLDYSSIDLTNSITNSDINAMAQIAYSKLNLTGSLVDSDVSISAAISRNKIANGSANHVIYNNGSGALSSEAQLSISRGGTGASTANAALNALLPSQSGNSGKVLQTDGTNTSWQATAGSGTVTSVDLAVPAEFTVSGNPITSSGTITITKANQSANIVYAGPVTGSPAVPSFRSLVTADLPALTTTDIAEGSNLYYTNERVDDRVAALLVEGTGIDLTYDDVGNSLTIASLITQYTDEQAQDATGAMVGNSSNVTLTYVDATPSLTADLTDTTVTPGSYGNASSVAILTVDAKGRLTAASSTAISLTSSSISNFNEAAQDAVGGILTDTASIDLTYNDGSNLITADVIPGGVDHNSLLNYVANQHVDHTAVQIATSSTSGLSGGGTIAATRSLLVDPTQATTAAPASGDIVLFADISNSNVLRSTTLGDILNLGGGKVTATWITGDGTTKAVTHSFGVTSVSVTVFDIDSGEDILVDSVVRTDANTVTLTSSQAPSGSGWTVVVRK